MVSPTSTQKHKKSSSSANTYSLKESNKSKQAKKSPKPKKNEKPKASEHNTSEKDSEKKNSSSYLAPTRWSPPPDQASNWRTQKKEIISQLTDWFKEQPLPLRAKAIQEKITLHQLGRILYHLSQRRGYLSNSRTQSEDVSTIFRGEGSKIGINETKKQLIETQATLGSYLYELHRPEQTPFDNTLLPIRNHYTTRQMYIDEFRKIWEHQATYHPVLRDGKLKDTIGGVKKQEDSKDGILFYQRPLKSQKHLIGHCTLEPKKRRIARSHPLFETFRTHQFVNSITCDSQPLSPKERAILVDHLLSAKKQSKFSALTKKIKKQDPSYTFNYNDDNCTVPINKTIPQLLAIKTWKGQSPPTEALLDQLWHALYSFDSAEALAKKAKEQWNLSPEEAAAFSTIPLPEGYAHLSKKAIKNILPFLKAGHQYDKAVLLGGVKNAFGTEWHHLDPQQITQEIMQVIDTHQSHKTQGDFTDPLKKYLQTQYQLSDKALAKCYHHSPSPPKTTQKKFTNTPQSHRALQELRNPNVIKALSMLKKYYNKIVDQYGAPDEVRVELVRELKASKKKRERIQKQQKENEAERIRILKKIREAGYDVTPKNEGKMITKYKLWEECGHKCPYTGKTIPIQKSNEKNLFVKSCWQIEHIHPQGGNHYLNKTISCWKFNQEKHNMIPYEYFMKQGGPSEWEAAKKLAETILPPAKFLHFSKEEREERFAGNQLCDTAYMSKKAKELLQEVCPKVRVSKGGVTSILRTRWKLNTILGDDQEKGYKNRNDHRHHSVDALIIAATEQKHVKAINDWHAKRWTKERLYFQAPWGNFAEDARKKVSKLLVHHQRPKPIITTRKHKVKKGKHIYVSKGNSVRGQLHEDSYYGLRQSPKAPPAYHKRVPVTEINKINIDKIVDTTIKAMISKRIEDLGGFIKEKGKWIPPSGTFFKHEYFLFLPNETGVPTPLTEIEVYDNSKKNKKQKELFPNERPTAKRAVEKFGTEESLKAIVDPTIKDMIRKRVEDLGGSNGATLPRHTFYKKIPTLHLKNSKGDPVPIKRVRLRFASSNAQQLGNDNRYVMPGNNHHIILYKDHKGNQKGDCVTFWEVIKRRQQGEKTYQLPPKAEDGQLLCSLQKGEMFLVTDKSKEEIDWQDKVSLSKNLYKVLKLSKSKKAIQIVLTHHLVAKLEDPDTGKKINADQYKKSPADPYPFILRKSPATLKGFKVTLSPLGELKPVPPLNRR